MTRSSLLCSSPFSLFISHLLGRAEAVSHATTGQWRYDGTTYAPVGQSPAESGGASSRVIEVARRKRTKLTLSRYVSGGCWEVSRLPSL